MRTLRWFLALLTLLYPTLCFGQIQYLQGGTPTVTSCGTNPSVSGSDSGGVINVGTGVSVLSCTFALSKSYGLPTECIFQAGLLTPTYSLTGVTWTLTFAVSLAAGKVSYICFGHGS